MASRCRGCFLRRSSSSSQHWRHSLRRGPSPPPLHPRRRRCSLRRGPSSSLPRRRSLRRGPSPSPLGLSSVCSISEKNKKERLKWCLSMLVPRSVPHDPMFKGMFDYIFIEEKWFYITRKTERYYTVCGEEEPTRTCKNKNYILKIQILAALARPRFDSDDGCTFDGKIGCFTFVKYQPAKRSNVNQPAGTIEIKPIESIMKDVMRAFMTEKVLPAIRAR